MRTCLAVIIWGLIGILSPENVMGAEARGIKPENEEAFNNISKAAVSGTKNRLCDSNCSARACKADSEFGKFCVEECEPSTVISCSKELKMEDLEAIHKAVHEEKGEYIFKVQHAHRTEAQAIANLAESNDEAKFSACRSCTKQACAEDTTFRDKFCLLVCPEYTTVKCGRSVLGTPPPLKDLFKYYYEIGESRTKSKGAWLKFANNILAKGIRVPKTNNDTYHELNKLWNAVCTPIACQKDPPTNPPKPETPSLADICNAYKDTPNLIVRERGKAILGKVVRSKTLGIGAAIIPHGNLQCTAEELAKANTKKPRLTKAKTLPASEPPPPSAGENKPALARAKTS